MSQPSLWDLAGSVRDGDPEFPRAKKLTEADMCNILGAVRYRDALGSCSGESQGSNQGTIAEVV